MNELQLGERDLLTYLKPDTLIGALAYLVLFVLLAIGLSRALRTAVHVSMSRSGHIDRTASHSRPALDRDGVARRR
jgi:small conductance mechanosensitive channel